MGCVDFVFRQSSAVPSRGLRIFVTTGPSDTPIVQVMQIMTTRMLNFGGNVKLEPASLCRAKTESDVLSALQANPRQHFRAIGSLHAWSEAAVTDGVLIEMSELNSVTISEDQESVWVGAGCKVKHLLHELARHDLTLPSVGLIDEQTVAGATATGTHGSGNHCLSHFIEAVRVAHFDQDGNATLSTIDSGDELLAARCSLGLLGVIVAIKFAIRGQYNIQEHAARYETLTEVIAMESSCPLQQFYLMPWSWSFFGHHRSETQQARSKLAGLYRIYNFTVIDISLHLVVTFFSRILKSRAALRFFYRWILPLTIARNWKVVDDSHAMLVMEHELFRHIEIEVFVPRSKVQPATDLLIDVLRIFGGESSFQSTETESLLQSAGQQETLQGFAGDYFHHYPICYRRVLPDETMLTSSAPSDAAASDEDWYAISFICYQKPSDREGFFKFADFIAPLVAELFGGRCHWGKYNPLTRQENEQLYPKLETFREIKRVFDPDGCFGNHWFDEVI